ncbi:MAG TPA: hypothetical protein VH120_07265, partial [Gemmataceae bacterium]|nr:hypothetical protein [Gemmataceae bacterium]
PDVLWLTAEAARLPGLVAALTDNLPEPTAIRTLPGNAVALAAHSLAEYWLRGDLPRGHLDTGLARDHRLRLNGAARSHAAKPV